MKEIFDWHNEVVSEKTVSALNKNGFDARYFQTGKEALAWILSLVQPKMTVGYGDSMTLRDLGVYREVTSRGGINVDHNDPSLDVSAKLEIW